MSTTGSDFVAELDPLPRKAPKVQPEFIKGYSDSGNPPLSQMAGLGSGAVS